MLCDTAVIDFYNTQSIQQIDITSIIQSYVMSK